MSKNTTPNVIDSDDDDSIAFKKDENHSSTITLLIAAMIILVVISVLFYRSAVDVKQLTKNVESFSEDLTAHYAQQNIDVAFNYTKFSAEGGLFHKTLMFDEASLSVADDNVSYVLHTPQLTAVPEGNDNKNFAIELASPVMIEDVANGRKITYSANSPLPLALLLNDEGLVRYDITLHNAADIAISRNGEEKNYVLGTDGSAIIEGEFSRDDISEYYLSATFGKANVAHNNSASAVDALTYNYIAGEAEQETTIHAENIVSDMIPSAFTPMMLDVSQRRAVDESGQSIDLIVDQFELSGKEYSISSDGTAELSDNALLPKVDINVEIDGADYVISSLETSHILQPGVNQMVIAALKRIAPEWNAASDAPLTFSIKRIDESPFTIGAIKADELFANILKEWYVKDVLPVSNSSKQKAIEAIDEPVTHAAPEKLADDEPVMDKQDAKADAENATDEIDTSDNPLPLDTDAEVDVNNDIIDDVSNIVPDLSVEDVEKAADEAMNTIEEKSDASVEAINEFVSDAETSIEEIVDDIPDVVTTDEQPEIILNNE